MGQRSRWQLVISRLLGLRRSPRERFKEHSSDVARPPLVPGYATDELLGLGGTGEVWAAREVLSGRPVALKRLRVATDIAAREGLRREGELLAAFQHPHVIGFHGLRSDGEGLVLVLERAATSLAAVVSGDKEAPKNTVVQNRVVTTFSSGVRLVWEKVNGVWIITEQILPVSRAPMTASAE